MAQPPTKHHTDKGARQNDALNFKTIPDSSSPARTPGAMIF